LCHLCPVLRGREMGSILCIILVIVHAGHCVSASVVTSQQYKCSVLVNQVLVTDVTATELLERKNGRNLRFVTMVCDTQNYGVSGLCPSFGILNSRKQNVLETNI
jgi:hypothetical protein